jgi:hypothetical protein
LPILRKIGLRARGQYNIRDTFITLALSAGEDPGWVAQVCGTSERMIFEHYPEWMNNLTRSDGSRIARLYGDSRAQFGHQMGTEGGAVSRKGSNYLVNLVEAGGIEPPSEGSPAMATTRLVRDLELAPTAPADGLCRSQPV